MSATMSADQQPYLVVDSPHEVANWRPLVHWLMYIPHYIIVYALGVVAWVVGVVYWFVVLFTGKPHAGLYSLLVMYERYNTRAGAFLVGYTEVYAPFDFDTGTSDNGSYPPITLNLPVPPAEVSRRSLANFLLAIPHYIVIAILGIGAFFVLIAGWFAVLFTGRWPAGGRAFLVRLSNYYYRVWSYAVMVQNDYPKFGLPAS